MKIVRITLIKRGYRTDISEVNKIVQDMISDVETRGFVAEESNIVMDMTSSNYEVEVNAERRGKNGSEHSLFDFGHAKNRQIPPCTILPIALSDI